MAPPGCAGVPCRQGMPRRPHSPTSTRGGARATPRATSRMARLRLMTTLDRTRLADLLAREQAAYADGHPRSRALHAEAANLFGRVPMTWMNMWSGGFPLYLDRANGNRVTDVDGETYVDFALGDTGAMAGHSPAPTIAAVQRRMGELGGVTTMLPTEDAQWVGEELTHRFGLPLWSFTLSATDANRWAIRLARLATGRSKILVFAYCYHGSVDETFAVPGPDGRAVSRPGNVAPPVPLDETTRVATWNDLASVERELAHGDVAAILTEPALTNIGIVLPEPGFMTGLRELATRYGSLLHDRRDAHLLGGLGRRDDRVGARAGPVRHRQVDRRRHPVRRLRHLDGRRRGHHPAYGRGRGRHRRRRRRRRHPRRQRPLDRGDAGHAGRGPHPGGLRPDDRARRGLHGRGPGHPRRARRPLVHQPAGRPRRVPVHATGAPVRARSPPRPPTRTSTPTSTWPWPTGASS